MMHDSQARTNPLLALARRQLDVVANVDCVHVAIVSSRNKLHVLEFETTDLARMLATTIPDLIRDTGASSVIVSSPDTRDGRRGAVVAILERTLEAWYAPVVRITNADTLIGDFRSTPVADVNVYGPMLEGLVTNWIEGRTHS